MREKYKNWILKEVEITPEKRLIIDEVLKHHHFSGKKTDKTLNVEDLLKCEKRKKGFKLIIEKLIEYDEDVIEKINSLKEKFDICVNEALGLYLRDCFDGSLLQCDHCLVGRCTFFSTIYGWEKYCSFRCSMNSKIAVLRDLSFEERKKTNEIRETYGFSTFEEARYFIDSGMEKKNRCKTCNRPTEFINYLKGYKPFCSLCEERNKKILIEARNRKRTRNNKESIKLVKEKLKEYGDSCYETMIKNKLKQLSQAAWHLNNDDPNCVLGRCANCGKRFKFCSFVYGYHKSKMCLSCFGKERKIVHIIRPKLIQLNKENIFISKLTRKSNIYDIDGKKIKRNEYHKNIVNGEKRKKLSDGVFELIHRAKSRNPIQYANISGEFAEKRIRMEKEKLRKKGFDPEAYELSNDPNWWYKLYVVDGMEIDEIEYYTGLSKNIIKDRLNRFGLNKPKNLLLNDEQDESDDDAWNELMIPIF